MPKINVKDYGHACQLLNRNPLMLPDVSILPREEGEYLLANYKLMVIAKAINLHKGRVWVPNYNDSNEIKYEPRFWIEADAERPAGFGFSGTYANNRGTDTGAGSRFAFKSADRAEYFAKNFTELHKHHILING